MPPVTENDSPDGVMVDLATAATPATTRVIPGLQHGDRSGDCRRCKPPSWGFLGQAHASGKAPHSHSHGLCVITSHLTT